MPKEATSRPNILLISLDALRADRLGLAGYERPTSPFLDSLAGRGLVFTQAIANTHGTTPSHTTMLSGLYQESHRVGWHEMSGGVTTAVPTDLPWLPQQLAAAGYETIAVTDGGNAGSRFGFARGFDHFDDRGGGIERVVRRTLHQLDSRDEEAARPVFVFLHTYEIHSPYDPPEPIRSEFETTDSDFDTRSENLAYWSSRTDDLPTEDLTHASDLYDAGIRYTDSVLARLFENLEQRGFLDDALVIVTSDHGEEFGEHGGLLHRGHLYDELLRIPLLVLRTGKAIAVIDDPVSLVDITPTILDAAGLEAGSQLRGNSLLRTRDRPETTFAQYGRDLYAVRTAKWKLLIEPNDDSMRLFDLDVDPSEEMNVSARHPEVVERLHEAFRRWIRQSRQLTFEAVPTEPTAAEKRRLRKLGYL